MLRLLLYVLVVTASLPAPRAAAQAPDPSPPAEVADEYQRAFQSRVWDGLVQRLHPEALAYVRLAVDVTVQADTTGWALKNLGGGAPDRTAYAARSDSRVVVDVMRWVETNAPGLLSSLVNRRSEVLGVVEESEDTAHAVYRIVQLVSGAEPEVLVLTLERTGRGWQVRDAPEIGTLHTAIRGLGRARVRGGSAPRSPARDVVQRRRLSAPTVALGGGGADQGQLGIRRPFRHGPVVETSLVPQRPGGVHDGAGPQSDVAVGDDGVSCLHTGLGEEVAQLSLRPQAARLVEESQRRQAAGPGNVTRPPRHLLDAPVPARRPAGVE